MKIDVLVLARFQFSNPGADKEPQTSFTITINSSERHTSDETVERTAAVVEQPRVVEEKPSCIRPPKEATPMAGLADFTSQSLGDASAAASQIAMFKILAKVSSRILESGEPQCLLRIQLRGFAELHGGLYQVLFPVPQSPAVSWRISN